MTGQDISSELQSRKELVSRVVSSPVICKSTRLTELFLYLCRRVLDESADHINELELGHHVFSKPEFYDTSADNTVRVHASTLRKRLADYFQSEGLDEPVVIEIPRGNYAPLFKPRETHPQTQTPRFRDPFYEAEPPAILSPALIPHTTLRNRQDWKWWVIASLAIALIALGLTSILREHTPAGSKLAELNRGTETHRFWSRLFAEGGGAQVVLDDASLDFYQQITGQPVTLAEYFDRSYLNQVDAHSLAAHVDPKLMRAFLLRRQSNFAYANVVLRLEQIASALGDKPATLLSRDFSFRQLKGGNVVLLGTSQSNPWIQAFEPQLALRWKLDSPSETYYPLDTTSNSNSDKYRPTADTSKPREGFASVALLPGLGNSGSVLIVSGSGGSAVAAAIDFLMDERSVREIRSCLPNSSSGRFPSFEALLDVNKGSSLPRTATLLTCRALK